MTTSSKRIGILGGTFDPVHFGHLRPAIELLENNKLDRLHLVPNHRPAHRDKPHASTVQRLEMLTLATDSVEGLIIDPREAERDKPSYTFDTLQELHLENPQAILIFCMGQDAFDQFESWHRWQEILELANIVVMDRPDAELGTWAKSLITRQGEKVGAMASAKAGAIECQHVTQLAISATNIRKRCSDGTSLRFLMPEVVRQYIIEHRLYQ